MKKLFMLLGIILLLSGCGKYGKKDLMKDLDKKINNADLYHLTGTLDIYRNEEKYSYGVDSSYKSKDNFKVDLINKKNNHEQIILKNNDGVYVLTPSLNKSFKFQSDWPHNNSQIYLLQPILKDLKSDSKRTFNKTKDGYILESKVDYSTEKDFKKQKIYVDLEKNITKVEILDESNNVKMRLNVIDIDYKPKFEKDYFKIEKYNIENKTENKDKKEVSKIENIVYPMYVPADTYLSGQDTVDTVSGERIILTFTGESDFTVVQESLESVGSTNYVYGDPYLVLDTVGSITDYSVSWISNGIEYSVMSDNMEIDELLTVAQSINVKAVGK